MRYVVLVIVTLIFAGFVSHTKIEFNPFCITVSYWYRGLGLILFISGITLMGAGEYKMGHDKGFQEGVDYILKLIEDKNNETKE